MSLIRVDELSSTEDLARKVEVEDLVSLILDGTSAIPVTGSFREMSLLSPEHGDVVKVLGRWSDDTGDSDDYRVDYGGGFFWFDSSYSKDDHDGGIIISPTVQPIFESRSNNVAFLNGANESDPGGLGCWRRILQDEEVVQSGWFGIDSESIQAAINSRYAKHVKVRGASYTLNQPITLKSHLKLEMDDEVELYCPEGVGPALITKIMQDSPISITSNVGTGEVTINVASTSGLSGGDWILVASEFAPRDNVNKMGEYAQISSVGSGTITLTSRLQFEHRTSDNAFVQRTDFYKDITVSGGKIRGERATDNQTQGVGIDLAFVEGGYVEKMEVQGFHYGGIRFRGVQGGHIRNCDFFDIYGNNSDTGSSPFLYTLGYSTDTQEGCRGVTVEDVRGTRVGKLWDSTGSSSRYGFSSGIVVRNVHGKNIRRQAIGSHVPVTDVLIDGVWSDAPFSQENRGQHWRGGHVEVRNMHIVGPNAGWWFQPENEREETRFTIRDSSFVSEVSGDWGGIVIEPRERVNLGVVTIDNCYVRIDESQPIQISMNVNGREKSNYIDRIVITNNTLYGSGSETSLTSDLVGAGLDIWARNDSRIRTGYVAGNQIRNEGGGYGIVVRATTSDSSVGRIQFVGNYVRSANDNVHMYAASGATLDKLAFTGGDYEQASNEFVTSGSGTVIGGYFYMNYGDGFLQGTF